MVLPCYRKSLIKSAIPIILFNKDSFDSWIKKQPTITKNWVLQNDFQARAHEVCYVHDEQGNIAAVLVGITNVESLWFLSSLPLKLPERVYYLNSELDANALQLAVVGWGMGAYQFLRYKKSERNPAVLVLPKESDSENIIGIVDAIYMVRDLVNVPSDDLGPLDLADFASLLAKQYQASITNIVENSLLNELYPAIYTVGRGSGDAPCLIDMRWGDKNNPKLTLVGKGICFDSGGLDLKPAKSMRYMKKDMAGAAHVFALAKLIMSAKLPVRLRVLVPAAVNAISDLSYHPGDIITMRNGKTVEIDNTDAEGRLILADALADAAAENPDLLIDFATLTGAASVALGGKIAAMFSNNNNLANNVKKVADSEQDPVWHMPLYQKYSKFLDSNIADMKNCADVPYGSAITAALFLQKFILPECDWLHFDIMAFNESDSPGQPHGGEAMMLRGIFSYLNQRFSVRH